MFIRLFNTDDHAVPVKDLLCILFIEILCLKDIYLCFKSEFQITNGFKGCIETDLLQYLPASSYVSGLLSLHYVRVIIPEALLELQQDALKQYLAVSLSDSKYDFLPLVPTCQNPNE